MTSSTTLENGNFSINMDWEETGKINASGWENVVRFVFVLILEDLFPLFAQQIAIYHFAKSNASIIQKMIKKFSLSHSISKCRTMLQVSHQFRWIQSAIRLYINLFTHFIWIMWIIELKKHAFSLVLLWDLQDIIR